MSSERSNTDRIELFCEINLFRAHNSKRRLFYSILLEREAQQHADVMMETESHNHGFLKHARCEIIAWDCNSFSDAFGWWINRSISHRNAILDSFNTIGIGIANKGIYVCRFH